MREIKFRGKTTLGKWVFGFLNAECVIRNLSDNRIHYCDKSTIGQYTGIKDKNGIGIYEGDVIKTISPFDDEYYYLCEYSEERGSFLFYSLQSSFGGYLYWTDIFECEIVGNKYDNSKLLNNK